MVSTSYYSFLFSLNVSYIDYFLLINAEKNNLMEKVMEKRLSQLFTNLPSFIFSFYVCDFLQTSFIHKALNEKKKKK